MMTASCSRPGSEKAFPHSPAEMLVCPPDRPRSRPRAQGPAAGRRAAQGVQPCCLASDPMLPAQGHKAPLDLGLAPGSASPRPIRAHSPGGLCPLAEPRRALPLSSGSVGGLGLSQPPWPYGMPFSSMTRLGRAACSRVRIPWLPAVGESALNAGPLILECFTQQGLHAPRNRPLGPPQVLVSLTKVTHRGPTATVLWPYIRACAAE